MTTTSPSSAGSPASTGSPARHLQTRAIHVGLHTDPETGIYKPPIQLNSNAELLPTEDGSFSHFYYTRWANPTTEALEHRLANLEGAEAAIFTASGMAAISGLLIHAMRRGGHIIVSETVYTNAKELFTSGLLNSSAGDPNARVTVDFVDTTQAANVAAAIREDTRLIYFDSPANPLTWLSDIAEIARIAEPVGALVAVDSTYSGMLGQQPIALGADIVVHSTTKYINGHGDALGGVILGRRDLIDPIRRTVSLVGGCASPFNAWMTMRGCATLPLRLKAHNDNALALARYLEGHAAVASVRYPFLPSHPHYELAMRQMPSGCGATLNFTLRTDETGHRAFIKRMRLIKHAVSLGDLETLVMYFTADDLVKWVASPQRADHYRAVAGPGFIRLSVGVEHVDDLLADLGEALALV